MNSGKQEYYLKFINGMCHQYKEQPKLDTFQKLDVNSNSHLIEPKT